MKKKYTEEDFPDRKRTKFEREEGRGTEKYRGSNWKDESNHSKSTNNPWSVNNANNDNNSSGWGTRPTSSWGTNSNDSTTSQPSQAKPSNSWNSNPIDTNSAWGSKNIKETQQQPQHNSTSWGIKQSWGDKMTTRLEQSGGWNNNQSWSTKNNHETFENSYITMDNNNSTTETTNVPKWRLNHPQKRISQTMINKQENDEDEQQVEEELYDHKGNKRLPIYKHKARIIEAMKQNQVVVVCGDTGCGKSTQIPQYIHEATNGNCKVLCSQPRRIAAISVSKRVAEEMGDSRVGQKVGYQISMDRCESEETKIMFITTGILVQRLVHLSDFDNITHIILDEVHERDLDIDFALVVLKKTLPSLPHIKLILMSATFDSDLFAAYFPLRKDNELITIRNGDDQKYIYSLRHLLQSPNTWFGDDEDDNNQQQCSNLEDEKNNNNKMIMAPILHVGGKCYPVTLHYLDDIKKMLHDYRRNHRQNEHQHQHDQHNQNDYNTIGGKAKEMEVSDGYYQLAVDIAIMIDSWDYSHRDKNAILIFLPGFYEIQKLYDCFTESGGSFWVVPLHSKISQEEQNKAFQNPNPQLRKVIIATNIAESSITVPDVRYVIDYGLTKELIFDANTNLQQLKLQWGSKASLNQRQGRASRVAAGHVFRLFSESFFESLPDYSKPEMQRCPMENIILQVKLLEEPLSLLSMAIQPPELSGITNAIENLRDAGGLTSPPGSLHSVLSLDEEDNSGEITFLGRCYAHMPLHYRVSRMIILAHAFGCTDEALIMAAAMSLRSMFLSSFHHNIDVFNIKQQWSQTHFSDSLLSLQVFQEWKSRVERRAFPSYRSEMEWCKRQMIFHKTLLEIDKLTTELRKRLESCFKHSLPMRSYTTIDPTLSEEKSLLLRCVLFGAFYPNYIAGTIEDINAYYSAIHEPKRYFTDPLCSVFVNQVPYGATENDLKESLKECGPIEKIWIDSSKAFIQFSKINRGLPEGILPSHPYICNALKLGKAKEKVTITFGPHREQRTLSGPYSPFSWRFHALVTNTPVIIERESVNTVFISSFSCSSRVMGVACYLQQSQNTVIASEVTILPPIPLIAVITALIFVPSSTILFRGNSSKTRSFGVLISNKLELDFNAEFTISDLEEINQIRTNLNHILSSEMIKSLNPQSLQQQLLHLIIGKQRRNIRVSQTPNGYRWIYPSSGEEINRSHNRSFSNVNLSNHTTKNGDGHHHDHRHEQTLHNSSNHHYQKVKKTVEMFPPLEMTFSTYPDESEYVIESMCDDNNNGNDSSIVISKLTLYDNLIQSLTDEESKPTEPELICGVCKMKIGDISCLQRISNPLDASIPAFQMSNVFGMMFTSKTQKLPPHYHAAALKNKIGCLECREYHHCGYVQNESLKFVTGDSNLLIRLVDGRIMPWEEKSWRNNFEVVKSIAGPAVKQLSFLELLTQQRMIECPLCDVTCRSKKQFYAHIKSRQHREEEKLQKLKNVL